MKFPPPPGPYLVELRCGSCFGDPVIEAYRHVDPAGSLGETKTDCCLRCQERVLPVPHPDDHLCSVCRTECLACRAPIGSSSPIHGGGNERVQGGLCRRCRGICRTCDSPTTQTVCASCLTSTHPDPLTVVLLAFPNSLLSKCGGQLHANVVAVVRAELTRIPARRLTSRIERRWWQIWAHQYLAHNTEGVYTPDECAYHLVVPWDCSLPDCEDGWLFNADKSCPDCYTPQEDTDRPEGLIHDVLADAGADGNRASPERAAAVAAMIRRELRRLNGTSRNDRSPLRRNPRLTTIPTPQPHADQEDPAFWPPTEPGSQDSPVLRTREEQQSTVHEAALQRARRDKLIRARRAEEQRTTDPR